RLMPPKVGSSAAITSTSRSRSRSFSSMSNTSMPANFLNSTALPSITGLAASGPMSPSPRTAVPLVTTPTRFPRLVYRKALAGSATISSHAAATPGEYAIARSRCVSSCLVGVTEIFPGPPSSWYSSAALRRSEGVDLGIWDRDLPARKSDGLSVHERAKTNALRQRPLEHARDVLGPTLRAVGDLVAATRAVGNHQVVGPRGAHRRQQCRFAHLHRHVVVLGLVAERAGHAAATRLDRLDLQRRNQPEHRADRRDSVERLLVAMPVNQRARLRQRTQRQLQAPRGVLAREKLLEQHRLRRERH